MCHDALQFLNAYLVRLSLPVSARGWGKRRWHGFGLMACVLLGVLWTVAPAQADDVFPVRYTGVLNILGSGSGILNHPYGVAVALDGTVYIADTPASQIVKVTPSGTTSVFPISGITPGLSSPYQLAVDAAGNLYIADGGNDRIVKSDPSGNGTVVATPGFTLIAPQGVAVDTSGDIFIADTINNRIVEVASSGTASVLTGTGSYLTSLNFPEGVATDIFGNLYIADSENQRVVEVTTSGAESVLSTNSPLAFPQSVAVDNTGIVYIADSANGRVAIVDPQGDAYDLLFDEVNSELGYPTAIAVSPFGTVYVADADPSQVNAFQVNHAEFGHVTLGSSGTPQTLNFVVNETATVTGVAIYTSGTQNLDFTIAANSGTPCTTGSIGTNCTVNVQFTPIAAGLRRGALVLSYTDTEVGTGTLVVPLSGIGDAPVAAMSPAVGSVVNVGSVSISEPFQTAYDGASNIYVTSYQNSTVSKIPAGGGSSSTVTIPALPSPSTINQPTSLAIDGAGDLFIADYGNSRIVEVTPAGTSKVIAIRGLSVQISSPTSLAFDLAGRLWVDDYGNGRIIVLSPDIYDNGNNDGDGTVGFAVAYVYTLGSFTLGSSNSTGLSVDLTGDIYFTDRYNNRILKADPLGNVALLSLPSVTLDDPQGVTVDPQGNIYVVDSGNARVIQLTTTGGISVVKYSGPPIGPLVFNAAPDNSDNLLISDFINNRLIEVNVGQSSLTFPNTNLGTNSTSQTTTVTNLGDQSLVFSANPTYTVNFSQDTTDMNPCTSDTSLMPGQSCDVPVIFSPQSLGSLSANITVMDNTQNVAGSMQQIAVSGTAIANATATTVTFAPTSSVYGQSVTIAATVSSNGGTPVGTVTLTDLTTSTTVGSNLVLIAGVATVNTSTLGAGSHNIQAVYTPIGNTFAGSTGSNTLTVSQANTTTALGLSNGMLTATVTAVAPGGGTPTGSVQFLNNNTVIGNGTLSNGTATMTVTATPPYSYTAVYAGNTNFTGSTSNAVTQTTVPTTTTVTFLPTSAAAGQSVSIIATVASNNGTPTGTVSFTDLTTATTLASNVSLSSGIATVTTSTLGTGSHNIQAVYDPTGSFQASNGSNTLTITQAGTTTTVTASPTSTVYGQPLTFTATVASSSGTPTGTLTFADQTTATTLASNVTLAAGTAAVTASTLAAGNHTILAVYTPTGSFVTSNGSKTVTIGKATTTTAITSSNGIVTATITVTAPGSGNPTGTVQFFNGSAVLGSAPLGQGTASFNTPPITGLIAVYSGDSNFNGSTSAPLGVTQPNLTLSGSPNPSSFGQTVTFTLSVASGGSGGAVQFSDGATALGTAPLNGGQASFSTSALAPGSHVIMATYGGASATVGQFVYGVASTVTLNANPTSIAFGQTVTLTAQLGPAPPQGIPAPTGQVVFRDSGVQVGSATVSAGAATLQLSTLAAGQHQLAAVYLGDKNWAASQSATVAVTVSAAPTSTTLVPTMAAPNQIVLTATVAASTQGLGVPTGSVQFVDTGNNNAVVGSATLSGGTASATFAGNAAAAVEGQPIAAVYSGNGNFSGSTSAPLPQMANAAWNSPGSFAPDEIASLYGITGLNGNTTGAAPLTNTLSGVTVTITDSTGTVLPALISGVYASASQINFLIPANAAAGLATVTISIPGGGTITNVVNIVSAAPGIFTANSTGQGVYAGQVVYVNASGSETVALSTGPVNLAGGEQVYLVLYGTGLRHASSVTATVNGVSVPVAFFGAQGASNGIDQVNVGPLPASLAGAGTATLVITADGQAANPVTFTIQ
jgi:large repetitive protein